MKCGICGVEMPTMFVGNCPACDRKVDELGRVRADIRLTLEVLNIFVKLAPIQVAGEPFIKGDATQFLCDERNRLIEQRTRERALAAEVEKP
jgi:hypothetical protein